MSKSNTKSRPDKPRPDFPLFPHRNGKWAKKVRGRFCYFTKWSQDPKGAKALEQWLDDKDELLAGRVPRSRQDVLTVADLCNKLLDQKKARVATGELNARTWEDYKRLCGIIVKVLGRNRAAADIQPSDWERLRSYLAGRWGAARLANGIQGCRGIWKWGYQNGLLESPMRFGTGFSPPSAKAIRQARNGNGPRMFEPEQIRALLKHADRNMRAMILLGLNGALGNHDLATLPIGAIDLERAWLDYPRRKTAIPRRIPLWPETVKAIRTVLAERAESSSDNGTLVFMRPSGKTYVGNHDGAPVSAAYNTVSRRAKVKGRTFYDLRRTFQTIGDGARDPVATSAIMGHAPKSGDMSAVYRQAVDDDRLRAVVDHVRRWLFAEPEQAEPAE